VCSSDLNYTGGTGGAAAIQYAAGTTAQKLVMMAFPFESITTAANRNAVMASVLNFFNIGLPTSATPAAPDLVAAKDSGVSSSDNITNLNNSSSGKALQFT